MLIASITALVILLSGGFEVFFFENVEKGIKKYVEDKQRQKELLSDVKEAKSYVKSHNKYRKSEFKEFGKLLGTYETTSEDFNGFFSDVADKQREFEEKFIDYRIALIENVTDEEWAKMKELSDAEVQKQMSEASKKKAKEKEAHKKTRKTIEKEIIDSDKRASVLKEFDHLQEHYDALVDKINRVNTVENEVITNKDASKSELLGVYASINEERKTLQDALVKFHEVVVANTAKETGEAVLKAFAKEIDLTSR